MSDDVIAEWHEQKRQFSVAQGDDSTGPLYRSGNALAAELESTRESLRIMRNVRDVAERRVAELAENDQARVHAALLSRELRVTHARINAALAVVSELPESHEWAKRLRAALKGSDDEAY